MNADAARHNAGLDRLRYLFASMKRYEPGHAPSEEKGFADYKSLGRAYRKN